MPRGKFSRHTEANMLAMLFFQLLMRDAVEKNCWGKLWN